MNYTQAITYVNDVSPSLSEAHQLLTSEATDVLSNSASSADQRWIAAQKFVTIYNENANLGPEYYDAADEICKTVDPSKPNGFTRPR